MFCTCICIFSTKRSFFPAGWILRTGACLCRYSKAPNPTPATGGLPELGHEKAHFGVVLAHQAGAGGQCRPPGHSEAPPWFGKVSLVSRAFCPHHGTHPPPSLIPTPPME
eukprot:EG_transcript_54535